MNEHVAHVLNYTGGAYWDSDWEGGFDSLTACSSCHNVHGATGADGSTNEAMIRDGSLAGRAGYGFSYVIEDVAGYPWVTSEGANQSESVGAIFRDYTEANMCKDCHGSPPSPYGSSYDATGFGKGSYLEYYRSEDPANETSVSPTTSFGKKRERRSRRY